MSSLVQIIARRQATLWVNEGQCTDAYIHHLASMSLMFVSFWTLAIASVALFLTFNTSNNLTMADIQSLFQTGQYDFAIATIYIQSINAKFDKLYAIMKNLPASGQYFGVVCLQETLLTSDADVTLFDIPGYKLTHQGSRCSRHGGLIIYLHEKYCYEVRNLYSSSDIWEDLFIDVAGHNFRKRSTIGNIYRPTHDNSNNKNIETFIM